MIWKKNRIAAILAMILAVSPIQSGMSVYAEELVGEGVQPASDTEQAAPEEEQSTETTVPTEESQTTENEPTDENPDSEGDSEEDSELEDENSESQEEDASESEVDSEYSEGQTLEADAEKKTDTEKQKVTEEKAKQPIDEVKELIAGLKAEPLNVTMGDRALIEQAAAAYAALPAADQARLDNETHSGIFADGAGTSQSYGRVLEACQWALYSLEAPDTSTTLPEGTYTSSTSPAVSGTSDKGKSTSGRTRYWTIEELYVDASHNASARISVNSDGYDFIQCAGNRYQRQGDSAAGTSCFIVPIDPNSTYWILGHSTVMPNSIAYMLTCSIDEPEISDHARVSFSAVNEKGGTIDQANITVNDGNTLPEEGNYSLLRGANYTVEVTAKGYRSQKITYTAAEDEDYVFTLKAADRLIVKAEDADTGKSVKASFAVNIVNTERTPVEKYRDGEYFLTRGTQYRITASASGYTNGSMIITSNGDNSVSIQMKKSGSASEDSSKAVKRVIDMIAALPSQPTEADRAAIINAQRAFIALESDEEKQVTNKARLDSIYQKLGAKKPAGGAGTYTFKTQSAGSGRGTYQAESIQTTSHGESMFRVVNAVLRVDENGKMVAQITLSGTGYRYLYMGSASAAFEAEEAAGGFRKCDQTKGIIKGEPVSYTDTDGKHSAYRFTIPVETLDHPLLIAGQSWAHDSSSADKSTSQRRALQGDGTNSYSSIWFQRAIILSSSQLVKVSSNTNAKDDSGVVDRKDGEDINETPENTASRGPGSGSQTVGKFAFSWSGGTMGHVTIQCHGVEIRGNQAYVTIEFVRKESVGGTAKFSQVSSLGQVVSGNNVFTIPVNLNANTEIEAYTTAMSQGHWVHYTIYVGVNDEEILEQVGQSSKDAGAIESTVGNNMSELDKEVPEIIGLKGGKEIKLSATKLLRAFEYDEGYYLIEVDLGKKPVESQVEETKKDASEEISEETTVELEEVPVEPEETIVEPEESVTEDALEDVAEDTGDGKKDDSKYRDESIGRAYQNRIVKYLVIPKGKEVPVGLEELVVMIQEPVSHIYVSSVSALKLLDENGDIEKVMSVGMKAADGLPESVALRMSDDVSDEKRIEFFGTYDDWKLKKMIKNKTDLIIEDARIIPKDKNNREDEEKLYKKLTSRASQMGTAVFIDRSDVEKDVKALEDWKTVYQILAGSRKEKNDKQTTN